MIALHRWKNESKGQVRGRPGSTYSLPLLLFGETDYLLPPCISHPTRKASFKNTRLSSLWLSSSILGRPFHISSIPRLESPPHPPFFSTDFYVAVAYVHTLNMATNVGTMRGTPSRQGNRGNLPAFNSPASNIPVPRPALDAHTPHQSAISTVQSEAAGSTMSASRQKQSKRDEVGALISNIYRDSGLIQWFSRPSVEKSRRTSARRSIRLDEQGRHEKPPQEPFSPFDRVKPSKSSQIPLSPKQLN